MNTTLTAGIVVTYHPNQLNLTKLVEVLSEQLAYILIVDNGSRQLLTEWITPKGNVEIITLGDNYGIARAQNVGIKRAKDLGVTYVALFDQDSELELDMLPTLIRAAQNLRAQGIKLACVGPNYIDRRQNNLTPFIRIEGLRLVRQACGGNQNEIPVDHLIASGSLIPMETLDVVGLMKEELFIDYVDLEWCERAKYFGYQTYGVCSAKMEHALGDEPIAFMNFKYPARSPLRHYYMFRNAIWIYRQPWPRWNWKCVDGLRLLRKFVFYSLFARPQLTHLKMMCLGLWHGLLGKMGRFNAS